MKKSVIVYTIIFLLFVSHSFAAQDRHVYKIETNYRSGIRSISYMYPDLTCLHMGKFTDEKIQYFENGFVSIQINRHFSLTVIPLLTGKEAYSQEKIDRAIRKRKSMWLSIDASKKMLDLFKQSLHKAESLPKVLGTVLAVKGEKSQYKFTVVPSSSSKHQQKLLLYVCEHEGLCITVCEKAWEFKPKDIETAIKLLEALPHMKNMLKAYIKTQK